MKKNSVMKKMCAVFAAAAVVCTSFAGCGGGGDDGSLKLSVSVYDRGKVPSSEGTYESNRWTKWINEQSGIDVSWVPVPRNESRRKLLALLAAGEAPDLIVDYDQTLLSTMVQQGSIMPVDEVIEKYSTTYKDYLEKNPDLKDYVTYDGQMYAITSRRSADQVVSTGMWIRQDWLDKLGLSMPTTTDELLEVARAFRDKDPDGNGVDDTVAISAPYWYEVFPDLFQATKLWYDEDGTLKFGPTLDRYGESVEYVKTLYDEGLIDREFITDKDNSKQLQSWVTGKAGIFIYNWSETSNKELLQNDPNANPVPMTPPTTKYGQGGILQETQANMYVAFNKDMKDPETAMKFIDWMLSDGWFTLKFGIEGEHYKLLEDGVPQVTDQDKYDKEVAYAYEYPIVSQWSVKPEWIPEMAAQDEMSQRLAKMRQKSLEVNSAVKFRRDIPAVPNIEEVDNTYSEFVVQRDDIRMQTITGGASKDKTWCMNQLRSEWKRLGGDEAERLMNEWWRKQDN